MGGVLHGDQVWQEFLLRHVVKPCSDLLLLVGGLWLVWDGFHVSGHFPQAAGLLELLILEPWEGGAATEAIAAGALTHSTAGVACRFVRVEALNGSSRGGSLLLQLGQRYFQVTHILKGLLLHLVQSLHRIFNFDI